jgi:hypothetical protein
MPCTKCCYSSCSQCCSKCCSTCCSSVTPTEVSTGASRRHAQTACFPCSLLTKFLQEYITASLINCQCCLLFTHLSACNPYIGTTVPTIVPKSQTHISTHPMPCRTSTLPCQAPAYLPAQGPAAAGTHLSASSSAWRPHLKSNPCAQSSIQSGNANRTPWQHVPAAVRNMKSSPTWRIQQQNLNHVTRLIKVQQSILVPLHRFLDIEAAAMQVPAQATSWQLQHLFTAVCNILIFALHRALAGA